MGCIISRHQSHLAGFALNVQDACKASKSRTFEIGDEMQDSESDPPPYTSVVDPRSGESIALEGSGRDIKRNVTAGQARQLPPIYRYLKAADDATIRPARLHPMVQELASTIESDPQLFILFHKMFAEASGESEDPMVRNYDDLLEKLNRVIQSGPAFTNSLWAGFPINNIFSQVMRTHSGQIAFLNNKFNIQIKKILREWSDFLDSPKSASVLNDHPTEGWFGEAALRKMPAFDQIFECDPTKRHFGFYSWNDFFTRRLRPGARPLASPEDNNVIINACESSPYRLAQAIKATDHFWIKSQPYSLDHMLDSDRLACHFHGGTVYQAYLSPYSYHRWHSPVSGRIVKACNLPGSYFASTVTESFDEIPPNKSQAYLTAVATRAMIFIEAHNSQIGLICFLAVGIAEASSCSIAVGEGDLVRKGQELGMFRYGGSTYCLIFRPQARLVFDLHGLEPGSEGENIPVNARIATLKADEG